MWGKGKAKKDKDPREKVENRYKMLPRVGMGRRYAYDRVKKKDYKKVQLAK